MTIITNASDNSTGYWSLRFANSTPDQGEVFYNPDMKRLVVGLKYSTWELLVPAAERRQRATAELARHEKWRAKDIRDPARTALVADLLDQPYGRPDLNLQPVNITTATMPLFTELFRKLLTAARASDVIEIKPPRTTYNPWTEKDVDIPAVTTPSAPIRAELEAIAAVVPDLQLDPNPRAVAA